MQHYLLMTVYNIGACNVPVDEWQLDIVASGSQKGYDSTRPKFYNNEPKAWKASERSNLPKFYSFKILQKESFK